MGESFSMDLSLCLSLSLCVSLSLITPTKRSVRISQAERAGLDKALKGENSESTRDHLLAETIVKQCTELPASTLL